MTTDSFSEPGLKLVDLFSILVRHWLLIAIVTVLCAAGALVFALTSTPMYRVQVVVAPAKNNLNANDGSLLSGQIGRLAPLAGFGLGGSTDKEEALATLMSRSFTEEFIRSENLLPVLFSGIWNDETKQWSLENPAAAPTLWDGYLYLHKYVMAVDEDNTTGMIELAIEWTDRHEAARWANLLIEKVNERIRQDAIDEAQSSIDYLKLELGKTSVVGLENAIYRQIEYQINKITLANAREEYAFKIIDPAAPPDEGSFFKPRTKIILIVGVILGLFLGVFAAFFNVFIIQEVRGRAVSV